MHKQGGRQISPQQFGLLKTWHLQTFPKVKKKKKLCNKNNFIVLNLYQITESRTSIYLWKVHCVSIT